VASVQIDGMVEEVCLDHLHATAFQHTPLGRTILGSAQNIQKMTKGDVEAYIRAHYTSGAPPCDSAVTYYVHTHACVLVFIARCKLLWPIQLAMPCRSSNPSEVVRASLPVLPFVPVKLH
jgi:hypothetical protein